ncbi:TnsA endonuclease N-terminal domain-containing protein [Bacillus sp. SJS]|uniref:TnsA endonuclease N-terminal domain-containing protein n=1 Tax=Bacillus sp. SJS TaxID=1423321 RepID=UPI0008264E9A|nr:TnsA endonuclease N-terminal domain-containing protein [Bacillus sp. SJS]
MPIQINNFLKKFNFPEVTIKAINNIRTSDPARKVRSKGRNVSGFYPSKKMGLTIQFESHKLELAGIYEKEHDSNVMEYYDQPPSFTITYKAPEGTKKKHYTHLYTADFFVIEKDWIGWEEWKQDEELIELSRKYPNRYKLVESGQWRCPPCESYAESLGLSFRICSSKDIDWTYQRNIKFLEDYLLDEEPNLSQPSRLIITRLMKEKPYTLLDDLLTDQCSFTADDVYAMIALGEIFVDINNHLIVDFGKFPLFINKEAAIAYKNMLESHVKPLLNPSGIDVNVGAKVTWDVRVYTIINTGENVITLLDDSNKIVDIPKNVFSELIQNGSINGVETVDETETEKQVTDMLLSADEKELESANRKYHIVQGMLAGGNYNDYDIPPRTIREWLYNYRKADETYQCGYVGLLSKRNKQGNRTRRVQSEVLELMQQYIEADYETIIQKSAYTVYTAFKEKCKQEGYSAPSFPTFLVEINSRSIHMQTKKRQGEKAAYETESFYFELKMTTPRHGDRPFEIGHIDHTELDIELICSETGEILGRPWITFMVDAFSRRILAFYLTYDPPSYRSCMMVIRECVRRHNLIPKTVVVDGGKDFHSIYFDTLIAKYKGLKKHRPGAKPRFGSVCERLFGTTNEVFVHNLLGNTKIMKLVRQVTKAVNPKTHAVWTLEELHIMFQQWCYEIYDTTPHSSLLDTPREIFLRRIVKTGKRKSTFIKYDETFRLLTLPSTKKGTAKVLVGQGLKINYFYYWAEILLHPDIEGKQVPVRYDPYNLGIAYAYVKNHWVTLNAQNRALLEGRTEKELMLITAEIRKKNKLYGLKKSISGAQIVDFLESAQNFESLQLQKLKDNALQSTFTV